MAIRNNAPREDFDDSTPLSPDPWSASGTPKMLVKIEGLVSLGNGVFEVENVKPRNIAWWKIAEGLGYGDEVTGKPAVPDALADAISNAVWDHDIREILAERIKRA